MLQLPFFFVAAYAFIKGKNWIRIPAIIYAVESATTVMPMLGEFLDSKLEPSAKAKLIAIYMPYMLVPLSLAAFMAYDPVPFRKASRRKKAV